MKAKLFIIGFLICVFYFTGHPQSCIYNKDGQFTKVTTYAANGATKDSTVLIADETWITYSKTGARIMTYSESVFKDVSLAFGEQFKRISILYKRDRNGPYKEYNIYLSKETASNIQQWAKTNL